jgi:hypothetical protein
MRTYRNLVLYFLEHFSEYNISVVPWENNRIADALATSTNIFKIPIYPNKKYEIEVKHRPCILDNVKQWKEFEDEKQIIIFLQSKEEYENVQIDEEFFYDEDENANPLSVSDGYVNHIVGREIIQLKNNTIPKGLVPLEKSFDENDMDKSPRVSPNESEVDEFNIGTIKEPKIFKLYKSLSSKHRKKYIELMRQFSDVFAWSYEDLKVYDKGIIHHTIPIKEYHKPFIKKLRRINPLVLSLIEKEIRKLFDAKIIFYLRLSKWLANLVPIRKKNGEIRLCIDSLLKKIIVYQKWITSYKILWAPKEFQCWMGFLDTTKLWCTHMTKRR